MHFQHQIRQLTFSALTVPSRVCLAALCLAVIFPTLLVAQTSDDEPIGGFKPLLPS